MYQHLKYKKTDPEHIFKFIQEHPFASMVIRGDRLLATHVPMIAEGYASDFQLFSHISNHNELTNFLRNGIEVLLIFQGAHGYVSSSWYQEKDVSTWDYSAVHINALIQIQMPEELEESLKKLVEYFEKNQKNPLLYDHVPPAITKSYLPLITGFSCQPFKIEAIAKLHQGYSKEDVKSIINNLDEQNGSPSDLSKSINKEHGTDY